MTLRIYSVINQYYHVYNRGVEKREIFNDQYDYQRFLLLLLLSNDTTSVNITHSIQDHPISELIMIPRSPLVSLCAFSLLANHYHMLVSPVVDGGVSKFMQKVATGYTMYFNNRNERSGALFQGKYKIKHVEDDRYLKYLFQYIHLNPIREEFNIIDTNKAASLIEKAEINPWTSLSVYSGKQGGGLSDSVLNKNLFEELFASYQNHRQSLQDWKGEE
jgi:REP element-mobilizing transposase RayT